MFYKLYSHYLLNFRPFNTVGALEKAKFAVEQQYAVVGVLEDLNTTLSVLEKYVPRFFEGVRDIYASKLIIVKINSIEKVKVEFISIKSTTAT